MKYAYENLSEAKFEELVVLLSQKLLGMSVQGFAPGRDGGRDAKFIGTADYIPSKSAPWSGTAIIQAKHTNGYNKSFSDTDFFSPESNSCVIAKEVPRIKALRKTHELDHYMLFSNRRLTANAENLIRDHICKQCDLPPPSVLLCGLEQIEMWLKHFSSIPAMVDMDPINSPLIVSPEELAEVVEALAKAGGEARTGHEAAPSPRVSYDKKNKDNNMTQGYAREFRRLYLKETNFIKQFLAAPENEMLLERYLSVAEEFQLKIIAKRSAYGTFDDLMNYLFDLLLERDQTLSRNRRLTRAVLFYMYWNCDIGNEEDDSSL